MNKKKIILSIAGSDNTSGAGLQADIKTCQLLGGFCLNVLTVVTSQGIKKVNDIQLVSQKLIKSQIISIFNQFKIDGIKIGLLSNVKIAKFIKDFIIKNSINCPLIIDPVFKSTTGTMFYKKTDYKKLFDIFSTINPIFTPNKDEVMLLISGKKNKSIHDILKLLFLKYKTPFIVTGISKNKKEISDYLIKDNKIYEFRSPNIDTNNTHGSGCIFSTSLCIYLANGFSLETSIKKSKDFMIQRLKQSPNLGVSYGPVI